MYQNVGFSIDEEECLFLRIWYNLFCSHNIFGIAQDRFRASRFRDVLPFIFCVLAKQILKRYIVVERFKV